MRLSRFDGSYPSDSFCDSGPASAGAPPTMARLHREGVCRGLFFLGCLALPVGLTYGAGAMHGFDRSPMTVASPAVRP